MFDYSPLLISLKTAFTSTFITFFLGIYVAVLVKKFNKNLQNIINAIITLPLVLPPTIIGFLLLLSFGKNGFIGRVLEKFDYSLIFSWESTVVAAVTISFPLMYNTSKGALEQIDENIISAAKTMNVSSSKIFWKIIFPLAWPGIVAGTILSFTRALGEFGATLIIAGNIPGKTQTIPLAIYFAVESGDNQSAIKWVIIVILIASLTIISLNFWNKKNYYERR